MSIRLASGRKVAATAVVFAVLGGAAGTLTAPSAPAETRCEMDRCGSLGTICITTTDKTGCDALTDGTCRTYACEST